MSPGAVWGRRLPFAHVQRLEPAGKRGLVATAAQVAKMKANMADAAYVIERTRATTWHFALAYVNTAAVAPLVNRYLAASRLPYAERASTLQARGRASACEGKDWDIRK